MIGYQQFQALVKRVAELERKLETSSFKGKVIAADYTAKRVRVAKGDLKTGWLPWITGRAGNDQDWEAPEVGEQVLVVCEGGEADKGVAIPAIYSDAFDAPSNDPDVAVKTFKDGAKVEYNRKTHQFTLTIPGDVTVDASGNATVKAGKNVDVDAAGIATVDAKKVHLNQGKGVVQGDCICQFTGKPHSDVSATVTAGKA